MKNNGVIGDVVGTSSKTVMHVQTHADSKPKGKMPVVLGITSCAFLSLAWYYLV